MPREEIISRDRSRPAAPRRPLFLVALAAVVAVANIVAPTADAGSVYANWQTVHEIDYAVDLNGYRITFDGGPWSSLETDEFGTPCSSFTSALVKSSAKGVNTEDPIKVDRMITELHIAWATGAQVRLWVHKCDNWGTTTYPKAYLVMVRR